MAANMNTVPQEIIDHIVSFLPRTPLPSIPPSETVSSIVPSLSSASLVDLSCTSPDRTQEIRKYFPGYATLSRRFQAAIEHRTFKTLTISSDIDELRALKTILNPERIAYIREFRYGIALPQGGRVVFQRFKQPAEKEANNKALTVAIQHLFRILNTTKGKTAGMNFCIENITSPSDRFLSTSLRYKRYQRSRLELLVKPEALPLLQNVTSFTLELTEHPLLPRVCVDLASRMPDLKVINLTFDAREILYKGLVRDDRHTLAAAILEHTEALKNVTEVYISLDHGGIPIDQLLPMPKLLYPSKHDPLGSALRRWSENLQTLDLQGCFDGTLFWPHDSEAGCDEYPEALKKSKLEQLNVQLERHSPSGLWYFMPKGHDDYGEEEDLVEPIPEIIQYPQPSNSDLLWRISSISDITVGEQWDRTDLELFPPDCRLPRNVPHGVTIEPLIESWAKALQYMPKLKEATLGFCVRKPSDDSDSEDSSDETVDETADDDDSMQDWQIIYQAPDAGEGMDLMELNGWEKKSRRIIFRNTRDWRPKDSTMDLLHEAGKKAHEGTRIAILAIDED